MKSISWSDVADRILRRRESYRDEKDLIRDVFNTPAGEELLDLWMRRHMMRQSFDLGSERATAFNEGMRSFVGRVVRQLYGKDAIPEESD